MFNYNCYSCKDPPKDNDPVSPIKIFAGGALYQRNPKQAPTTEPQKIDSSPTSWIYCICKYSEKLYYRLHKKLM